jgi:hypothetical protein
MASLTINETPQSFGDGTKNLHLTIEDNSTELKYAFGETLPTEWHTYEKVTNDPMNIGTMFGKVWFKTEDGNTLLTISVEP